MMITSSASCCTNYIWDSERGGSASAPRGVWKRGQLWDVQVHDTAFARISVLEPREPEDSASFSPHASHLPCEHGTDELTCSLQSLLPPPDPTRSLVSLVV